MQANTSLASNPFLNLRKKSNCFPHDICLSRNINDILLSRNFHWSILRKVQMTHVCVSFYKWTMRSVLKQEYLSGILILGRVVKRARMMSVMFYKAVGRGDSVLTKRKKNFQKSIQIKSCILKTCLRLVGCVICSSKAVAMALVILQFCQGAKAAKIENPHLLNECTNTEKCQTFFCNSGFWKLGSRKTSHQ